MIRVADIPGQWRTTLASLAIVIGGVLLFYWHTAISIVNIWWRSGTFAHGFLILPISGWLIWQKRHELGRLTPKPTPWMGAIVAGLGGLWLLASSVDVLIIQQLCLVTMLIAAAIAVMGWRAARVIMFPLAFLYFAVPMGEDLIPHLMHFTAAFTVKALQLTNIPVLWEGMYITLPNGKWEVAAACSGVRYLIASVTLGVLYAYLMYASYTRRIIFTLVSIAVPIIANGLRAYMIVMIGYLSSMKLATGVDHIIYGWIFFGLVIGLLFFIGSFWREDLDHEGTSRGVPVASAGPGAAEPARGGSAVVAVLGVLGVAVIWPALSSRLDASDAVVEPVRLEVPVPKGGWHLAQSRWDWRPRYLNPQGRVVQSYTSDDGTVSLFIEYYREQKQGAELVDSGNQLVPEEYKKWRYLGDKHITIGLNGKSVDIVQADLDSASTNLLVWQWYWIGGHVVINPYEAKLREAVNRLMGRTVQSAAIIMATDYEFESKAASARLRRFVDDMYPSIEKIFVGGEGHPGVAATKDGSPR